MEKIVYEPIGLIHTPFETLEGMPIQPAGAKGIEGWVEVEPRYKEALSDLEGFSHIFLIYHLHRSSGYSLKVVPFLDTVKRGLFSTRAPRRPNPIGISVVRLKRVDGNRVYVADVDMLDGTPLLDIKPCVREFDATEGVKIGWLEGKTQEALDQKSDTRFSE
ncbi:MAG: tRNA (N6-threonylcarbamoyladenosine(37)-N6)-methyltransferase TrmO [Candidatus Eisenbacteria bacterium]